MMNSLSSTQSFTKDIYSRMKQISADLLQLKRENNELHNKNISSLEERLSRLEIMVETKLNIIIEKLETQTSSITIDEQTDDALLEKLDDIKIISSPIISSSLQINNENINNNSESNNIEQINFDKFFNSNMTPNNINDIKDIENKKEKVSINNIDDILIL